MTDIYLNYAGVAPISSQLADLLKKFVEDMQTMAPPEFLLLHRKAITGLSQEASKLLHCDPEEITYIKNTTEGLIIAAESLPLEPGDEVLVLSDDYSANLLPWLKRAQEGILVTPYRGLDSEEAFCRFLDHISPRTRAIAVSWVRFQDGFCMDMRRLSRVCSLRDIFLVVDGIQILGTRAIDLEEIPVDFLACGGHKHLMSVMGSGLLYVNRRIMHKLKPFKVGTRSVESFDSTKFCLKSGAARFEDGSPNLFGIFALYCSLNSINSIGISKIEDRNIELQLFLKNLLFNHGIKFFCFPNQGNICLIPDSHPEMLAFYLEKSGVITKPIRGGLRASFSHLSTEEDLERFARLVLPHCTGRPRGVAWQQK